IPKIFVYSIAMRSRYVLATGCPSSDTATAPDRAMSPISASSSPRPPLLTQPIGKTFTAPLRRASATMYSVTDRPSFHGSVFGMQAIEVNPPAAAALVPVSTLSLCSCPGSRRCTCMSTNPGQTQWPAASSTFVPAGTTPLSPEAPLPGRAGRRSAMRPSTTSRSRRASVPVAGSMTRPPLISKLAKRSSRQQIEHGHPDGDPVGDLIENDRVRPIRHGAVDLHPAVHRAGMHDDGVRPRPPGALDGQAVEVVVLPRRREGAALLALSLDAQHHHDVGAFERLVDPPGHLHPKTRQLDWRQGRRGAGHNIGAHRLQQEDVATQHPAVHQVTDDRHAQPLQLPLLLADGEGVQERLRRVLV